MNNDEKTRKIDQAKKARRRLDRAEMKKRGCEYCMHIQHIHQQYLKWVNVKGFSPTSVQPNSRMHFCPFEVCPCHELDKIKRDYVKEYDQPLTRRAHTFGRRAV